MLIFCIKSWAGVLQSANQFYFSTRSLNNTVDPWGSADTTLEIADLTEIFVGHERKQNRNFLPILSNMILGQFKSLYFMW